MAYISLYLGGTVGAATPHPRPVNIKSVDLVGNSHVEHNSIAV